MKKTNLLLILAFLAAADNSYAASLCLNKPLNGPQEIITCLAQEKGMTAEGYWNSQLFNSGLIDGFCQKPLGNDATTAQQEIYQKTCKAQAGSYFSYANFIAADQNIANKLGSKYGFMRTGSTEIKLREFANFLATLAQETTAGMTYTTDGLYFRYENGALGPKACYTFNANPNANSPMLGTDCATKSLASYYTGYYPKSVYTIAVNISNPKLTYTGYIFDSDAEYVLVNSPITVAFPGGVPIIISSLYPSLATIASPPVIGWASWKNTLDPLTGYKWAFMNDQLEPGYWLGMGNLQLTGDSMTKFFGWYYQNLTAPTNSASFQNFVNQYLVDGQLAWEGGLWYWNFRVNGSGKPTLHSVLTNTSANKAACHDIGITTWLVNGGCNNATERVKYYQYFAGKTFKLDITGVNYQGQNSMQCAAALGTICEAAN